MRGVGLVTSDAHPGLVRAVSEVFQGAAWQRCVVHLMRDCARAAGSRQLSRRVSRIVAPVFRLKEAGAVRAAYVYVSRDAGLVDELAAADLLSLDEIEAALRAET